MSTETTYDLHNTRCPECDAGNENTAFDWSFLPQAYCISLKERDDRTVEATKHFHSVGLCKKVIFIRPSKDKSNAKRPGTRGCWESHRFAAKLSLNKGFPFVLVFEDDVAFDKNVTPQRINELKDSFNDLPVDWTAYFIGHWPVASIPYKKNIVRTWSLCMHAYFMQTSLMQWISDHPFDETLFANHGGFGIDCYLAGMKKVYAFYPMIAYQSGSVTSNPKPKLGGRLLDMALSDPRNMQMSQHTGLATSLVLLIAIVVLMIIASRAIIKGFTNKC